MKLRTLITSIAVAAALSPAFSAELLEVGRTFPAFELQAHDGTTVSSSELLGKTYLLFFYPMADTPGCTIEACAFRDRWDLLEAADVAVYGVSFDAPEANAAFAEKYQLPFPLLSDTDGALARQVGAAKEGAKYASRISYMIGEDGKVRSAYGRVNPLTHADEVIEDTKD